LSVNKSQKPLKLDISKSSLQLTFVLLSKPFTKTPSIYKFIFRIKSLETRRFLRCISVKSLHPSNINNLVLCRAASERSGTLFIPSRTLYSPLQLHLRSQVETINNKHGRKEIALSAASLKLKRAKNLSKAEVECFFSLAADNKDDPCLWGT
jgi:hypothetical protein